MISVSRLKKILVAYVFLALLFNPWMALGQDAVRTNIITRVFRIEYGAKSGSSFTIDVDDRQYLITAKHLVPGIQEGDSIRLLRRKDTWVTLEVKLIFCDSPDVDIVALALPEQISPSFPVVPTMDGIFLGQDVFFLGFPYGLATYQDGWSPIPFVKKGILSMIDRSSDDRVILHIDGLGNPGFSGGPVVFRKANKEETRIAGVVIGFEGVYEKVLRPRSENERLTLDNMDETGLFVRMNSGIMTAHKIDHIVEAIRRNPIGPPVVTTTRKM